MAFPQKSPTPPKSGLQNSVNPIPAKQGATPQANGQQTNGQPINVDAIIAKIQLPPNLKPIFDKALLTGMRIMFGKDSHAMMEEQLNKPGPLADKLTEGFVSLIYLLYTQSNRTLPPQIIVPLTMVLTLKAFDFLQRAGEPDADKNCLGIALTNTVTTIMQKFGVDTSKLQGGAPQPGTSAPQPQNAAKPTGLLAQGA